MRIYSVISTSIQILVKCQLSSFVPDPSPVCTRWTHRNRRSQAHCFVPCHPAPAWAVDQWPSRSGTIETGCYLRGWTGPHRFVETNKMVAFLQVIRTPALTVALTEIAKCLSPAPSFCFQNGMVLSANSYYICASMQMMNLGFLRVLTPCSPIPD